jgi:hypothetical protein
MALCDLSDGETATVHQGVGERSEFGMTKPLVNIFCRFSAAMKLRSLACWNKIPATPGVQFQ